MELKMVCTRMDNQIWLNLFLIDLATNIARVGKTPQKQGIYNRMSG
jgi:hypothetical protein